MSLSDDRTRDAYALRLMKEW